MNAVTVTNIQKTLPRTLRGTRPVILHDISFAVEAGQCHGLVGANGAGKSTTLRILMGVAFPSGGTCELYGIPSDQPRARARVGFAPDIAALSPTLTADETCRLHHSLLAEDDGLGPEEVLSQVDLLDRRKSQVGSFSKGMQQRLSLAIALLGSPRLLVLDEPMSGLDPIGRDLVRTLLRERHQRGVTLLFSSHVLSDVNDLCDSVTVIARGRTVYTGAIDTMLGENIGHRLVLVGDGHGAAWSGPGTHSVLGDRSLVEVVNDLELENAIRVAREAGLRVRAVEGIRPSLEERVREMVGEART